MEFLNKLLKIKTSEDRILMGKLKSLDYKGNLYLSHAVEVYFKEEGFYSEFEIFDNDEFNFSFESESHLYQIIGEFCINKSNIKEIKTNN